MIFSTLLRIERKTQFNFGNFFQISVTHFETKDKMLIGDFWEANSNIFPSFQMLKDSK